MNGERFVTALARNTLLAAALGALIFLGVPRRSTLGWDYLDAFTLAFCFTFIGYLVEVVLLKIPEIEFGAGRLIRIAGWFGGGLWCYVVGRYLWVLYGRDLSQLPSLFIGGVFFVALELVVHALLNAAGKPNFFRP